MFYQSEDFAPVSPDEFHNISMLLAREYRLLDEERFDDWLAMLHPEIHYWMPGMENRRRENPLEHGFFDSQHMALFDDAMRDLKRRVARFQQPSAWAENPATRTWSIPPSRAFAPVVWTKSMCSAAAVTIPGPMWTVS